MSMRHLIGHLVAGLLLLGSSGCCCFDSYYSTSCDFGGGSCGQVCGSNCGVASGDSCTSYAAPSGTVVGNFETRQLGCGSCDTGCTGSCGGSGDYALGGGCFGWDVPRFFVDGNGNPCLGPFYWLAETMKGAAMSCVGCGGCGGCGEVYVDEWVSDPPLASDPCDCSFSGGGGSGRGCTSCSLGQPHQADRNYEWGNRSRSACSDGSCQAHHAPTTHRRSHQPVARSNKSPHGQPVRMSKAPAKQARSRPSQPTRKPVRQVNWFN